MVGDDDSTCESACANQQAPIRVDGGSAIKDFRESWDHACKAAVWDGLLFHDLRRTAARNFIRAGNPEKTVLEILGHKTAAMLWRYNIIDMRDIKRARKRAEAYLEQERARPTEKRTNLRTGKPS